MTHRIGNNLITNGTLPQDDPSALGVDFVNGEYAFPYGMQWIYPCGGMPQSTNRSLWPVDGGAITIQPGWFPGHLNAQFYINVGINGPGEAAPPNMSHNVVPPFSIHGPSDVQYNGSFCLPQVPLPTNVTFNIGDNITIQVVELAQHGAAIYNCADVTLADPKDVPQVNASNCFNSTDLEFQLVFTTTSLSAASSLIASPGLAWSLTCALAVAVTIGLW
jgi:hypothetical protein